jgi:type-1 restriction enzyme ecoR124II specificity protein
MNETTTKIFPYLERLLDGEEVEWKTLGEVCDYEQPTAYLVRNTNYSDQYPIPVLTAGKTFILGYTNETTGIYRASEHPTILFDDFTTANKWVDFDFKAKSSAMKMLTSKDEKVCLLKYIFYWLNTLPADSIVGDHSRQWISNYAQKSFPVPPLRVQARIVEILDKFTQLEAQLEAELQAELEARRKQYAYYRDHVLISHNTPPLNVNIEWKTLGEVCDYIRGITYSKTAETTDSCGWKVLRANNITLETRTLNFDEIKRVKSATRIRENQMLYRGDILICAGSGSKDHIGKTAYIDHNMDCTFGGFMGVLRVTAENTVSSRFLFHYIGSSVFINYLKTTLKSSTINNLNAGIINPFPIPIPPLSEQRRIVDILDRFDTLTNSISEGLTKEIALRRKQYAYYRDALLSFPRPEVSA